MGPSSNNEKLVECAEHGPQPATFVCRHIVEGLQYARTHGFWSAHDPGNPRPDAWCDSCNDFLKQHDSEWNDATEAYACVTLLCGACYDRAREMNRGAGVDPDRAG